MPSTPMAQTRQLRPRYNNDTIQSQSPFPQIPSQSQSQSHSGTTTNTDTNITGTVPSQVDCTAHASRPLSSSLRTSLVNPADYLQGTSATEGTFSALQTPFIPHTLPTPPTTSQRQIDASPHNRVDPTSNSSQGQSLSRTHVRGPSNDTPPPMASSYPNTPSPPNTYGINGTLIVADPTTMMAPPVAAECQPFQPSQPDVFMSQTKSSSRGVLRPSFSYGNTGTQPTSWNRRIATDSIVPSSTSSRHDHGQGREHVENAPPAMGSFAAPPPVPVHANATAPSPYTAHIDPALGAESKVQPSSYPPPPSHTPQHNPQQPPPSGPPSNATPYSDEYPFHNNSGSYDASFGSPWTANSSLEYPHAQQHPPPAGFFPGPHPFYVTTSNGKKTTREPILAPGEVPAPRPPLSYASLIGEALLLAPPPHQLYVSEISESIKRRYQFYRQYPSKLYNGVRHQTSMHPAFVKVPRPYGDQGRSASRWALRAGCETWFAPGATRPPIATAAAALKRQAQGQSSSHNQNSPPSGTGKAKATARAKQLAIGTGSPKSGNAKVKAEPKSNAKSNSDPYPYLTPYAGAGPSVGPAYNGTDQPYWPYGPEAYAQSPSTGVTFTGHGYYYTQIPGSGPAPPGYAPYPQPGSSQLVPVWSHTPPASGGPSSRTHPVQPGSPLTTRDEQQHTEGQPQHPLPHQHQHQHQHHPPQQLRQPDTSPQAYYQTHPYAYAQPVVPFQGPGSHLPSSAATADGRYGGGPPHAHGPAHGHAHSHSHGHSQVYAYQHHHAQFPQSDERPGSRGSMGSGGSTPKSRGGGGMSDVEQ